MLIYTETVNKVEAFARKEVLQTVVRGCQGGPGDPRSLAILCGVVLISRWMRENTFEKKKGKKSLLLLYVVRVAMEKLALSDVIMSVYSPPSPSLCSSGSLIQSK